MELVRLAFPRGPVWCDQVYPSLFEVVIESIAVIRTIADQALGFGLQQIEVETPWHQSDLMMIGRMCTHRELQPMAIHNRKDLHAFATAGVPHSGATAFGRGNRRIDEALALVDHPFLAQRIRQLRENLASTSHSHHC